MSDEFTLRKDVERAAQAQRLMDDPLLAEAFDMLDDGLVTAWRNTRTDQMGERERLWMMARANASLREHLQRVIEYGKHAADEIAAAEAAR